MTLNDLIPPEKWHEMTHNLGSDYESMVERRERIKLYAPAILKCIRECGSAYSLSESVEVNMILTTLALVDHGLSQIKSNDATSKEPDGNPHYDAWEY